MLAQARKLLEKSLGSVPASFLLEHADVRKADFPDLCFDLVATHFFLDCFEIPEIESLIRRVTQACQPGALWVISEFAQPVRGWKAVHATLWLGVMYRWFQLTTGLKTKKLPDFQPALCDHGWKKVQEAESPTGLIRSEMWSLEHNRAST